MKKLFSRSVYKKSKNKGSALIFTLIIGNLLLILSLFLATKIDNLSFYNSNLSKYKLREDIVLKQREYVMTSFNNYFLSNLQEIKAKTIPEFFKDFNSNPILYDKATIKYNKSPNEFFIETKIGYNSVLIQKFNVDITESAVRYKFLH